MLQLHPNFDMRALETLVLPKVVGKAVNKVEKVVVVARRATLRVTGTSGGGVAIGKGVSTEALEVVEIEDAAEG